MSETFQEQEIQEPSEPEKKDEHKKKAMKQELYSKLKKAYDLDSYFITITSRKGGTLNHFWFRHNFNENDILPSMDYIKRDVAKKELEKGWE